MDSELVPIGFNTLYMFACTQIYINIYGDIATLHSGVFLDEFKPGPLLTKYKAIGF